MLIDTHFHLDLMNNMLSLIRDFRDTEVGIIAVGTTPKAYTREKQFCSGTNNIKVGLGMHPQLIADRYQEIELFMKLSRESRFIGEVGLDFNSDYVTFKDLQILCFRKIAWSCANESGKVLSIHNVKSTGTVIDELAEAGIFKNNICILHWFTGSPAERRKAIEAGALFSINPKMLRTKNGQETIRAIPYDRILLETDAPFTGKISSAIQLKTTLERMVSAICEIRGENIQKKIEENSERVFM